MLTNNTPFGAETEDRLFAQDTSPRSRCRGPALSEQSESKCCPTGIRTPINGFKGRCPTIRRSGNVSNTYRVHKKPLIDKGIWIRYSTRVPNPSTKRVFFITDYAKET